MDISINGKVDHLTGIFTLESARDQQRLLAMEVLHIVPHTPDKKYSLALNDDGTASIIPFFGDLNSQSKVIPHKEESTGVSPFKVPEIVRAP